MSRILSWSLIFVLITWGPSAAGQASDRDLADRWNRIAQQRIDSASAYVSPDSGAMLRALIADGAARALRDHASPEALTKADRNIERFVDKMLQAGTREANGKIRLGENSFSTAKSSVCPLYPFC